MISVSAHRIAMILFEELTSSIFQNTTPSENFNRHQRLHRLPKNICSGRFGDNLRTMVLKRPEAATLDGGRLSLALSLAWTGIEIC